MKVWSDEDEGRARKTVHRLWPNEALPGGLAQILPTPEHFGQAGELVTEDMVADEVPCGPDVDRHVALIKEYADAGFDELYINQIGPEQDAFRRLSKRSASPRTLMRTRHRAGPSPAADLLRRATPEKTSSRATVTGALNTPQLDGFDISANQERVTTWTTKLNATQRPSRSRPRTVPRSLEPREESESPSADKLPGAPADDDAPLGDTDQHSDA